MESNQNSQTPIPPTQTTPLQNPQPDPKIIQDVTLGQEIQDASFTLPIKENIKKEHSWISYVLIVLSVIQGVSVFFGEIGILQILGAIYYFITAFFLFKKPKVGYIMFGIAIILLISALIIYRYISSY